MSEHGICHCAPQGHDSYGQKGKKAVSFYDSFHAEGLRLQSNIDHGGIIK